MALTVKGGSGRPPTQPTGTVGNAVAEAYARLNKKKGKKGKKAADAVGDLLDDVVGEQGDDFETEAAMARTIADEVSEELPDGSGMEQAEAIAEKLKEKIESTRGQRDHLAQRIQKAFDDLDG